MSATRAELDSFVRDLVRLKDRALRLGLYPTLHELDDAATVAGYDVARLLTGDRIPPAVLRRVGHASRRSRP